MRKEEASSWGAGAEGEEEEEEVVALMSVRRARAVKSRARVSQRRPSVAVWWRGGVVSSERTSDCSVLLVVGETRWRSRIFWCMSGGWLDG